MSELNPQDLTPNKQALLKIRELKQRLAEAQACSAGPIAIVSMACRFPRRSRTPQAFWESLLNKECPVGDIPEDRWDLEAFYDRDPEVPGKMYARRGVFLDGLDQMDPEFFGISPREATWVDPQQRLLMETSWEAMERVGWPPEKIGDRTGVFVGWMHNDYQNEASDSFLNLNPYIATGAAGSFLSGRLAHYLGLSGPSLAVDTACSSSLVALHLACRSLHVRDCDRALVGGVNAILSPTTNILTCKLKALSPEGRSRAFAAGADGYLRGEGCGVIAVRRLEDAERDGDPILAVIRGSAVGHNGAGGGLTVPNPRAQESVIREALQRAGVPASAVSYLEAHGTGTELGDPIELKAASAAYGVGRNADDPLLVGSVKTNIGHLEAAAGMAGLIKVLLAFQNDQIPAQLHFDEPNPHIPWDSIPVRVVTDATRWPKATRLAGISAFGMSGTNAHVVLEAGETKSHSVSKPTSASGVSTAEMTPPRSELVVLSAKSEEALDDLVADFARRLHADESPELVDIAYTTGVGRSHMPHRVAAVAASTTEIVRELTSSDAARGVARQAPRVVWQFTGQGSQYPEMARVLYEASPKFRESLDRCDQIVKESRGESLLEVMFRGGERIHDTRWTQPAIFALQMGLVRLLREWGLEPDAVMGHSVGQYAAACTAGVMPWEAGLRLICERGRLIGDLPPGGGMLAVFAKPEEIKAALPELPDLGIAAINGGHTVISGAIETLERAEHRFAERGVRTKRLTTSHAFHSELMAPALHPFQRFAEGIEYKPGSVPLICNVTGEVLDPQRALDGAYWAKHIREPVRYAASVERAASLGCEVMLEIGPQSVLTRMAAASWPGKTKTLIGTLEKGAEDEASLLAALGRLYAQGVTPDFEAVHAGRGGKRVALPTYPFQTRRFWGPDKPAAFHSDKHTAHPLLGGRVSLAGVSNERRYENHLEPNSPSWLADHAVNGAPLMPGAALLEMAIAAGSGCTVHEASFQRPLQPQGRTELQTVVRAAEDGSETVEVYASSGDSDEWTRHFSAKLSQQRPKQPPEDRIDLEAIRANCPKTAEPAAFYARLRELDLEYGPAFQAVAELNYSETEVLSRLKLREDLLGYTIAPPLLDGALHTLAAGLIEGGDDALLPTGIGELAVFGEIGEEVWCHGAWGASVGDVRRADLTLCDGQGAVLAKISDLQVKRVSREAMQRLSGASGGRLAYSIEWKQTRLPATNPTPHDWLLIHHADAESEAVEQLADELASREHRVVTIALDTAAEALIGEANRFRMSGREQEPWDELFSQLSAESPYQPDGVAWFLGGDEDSADPLSPTEERCRSLLAFMSALKKQDVRRLECGLQFITRSGMAVNDRDLPAPHQGQYWGLGRVLGAEEPGMNCRLVDLPAEDQDARRTTRAVAEILTARTTDGQFAVRGEEVLTPRLDRLTPTKKSTLSVSSDKSYLITGGLGDLGRLAADWLALQGAGQVVLVSRREPDEAIAESLEAIRERGCEVIVHPADLSSREDVETLFSHFGEAWRPLGGVIHAAGVLDDGLLIDQSWERFERVLAPKVRGAELLDEHTASLELDFFVLYSSAASVLGSPGQSNYATANAYLDSLAARRRAAGLPALSLNWGPWDQGMASDERIVRRMAYQGVRPLSTTAAHEIMAGLIQEGLPQATVIEVDWRQMASTLGENLPSLLVDLVPDKLATAARDSEFLTKLRKSSGAAQRQMLVEGLQAVLQGILSLSDKPETDRPLIEMGLDSLMAVEFGAELQRLLGDQIPFGPTMLFDHPTIDAVAEVILEQVNAGGEALASVSEPLQTEATNDAVESVETVREDIAIIGMGCRFPGADSVEEFWQNLLGRVDSVGEIPPGRWDVDRFYSEERAPGKMVTREGGFLVDIDRFDAAFFDISEQEAAWIDPQHRLLLENSHRALEDAGLPTQSCPEKNVGVFMGIMGQDYAFLPKLDDTEVINAFQGAGLSHSAGVGRISYAFGFEGPSVAVDTASSSSLVAVMQAVRSLQEGACNLALAGGVNAILAPVNSLLMSRAGLLAPDGRCKSFSAAADGFGRGEGCGVVVLKRLSDAQRDGDRVLAVIRGGAVVHNGVSGGITAPNGKSQARVITEALKDARIAPSQVQYLEAHGTGTEYGDPIELNAAASVYGKGRKRDQPLYVGSVKPNISHLEAAGGVSGLIKTVLCLQHGVIPGQLHLDEPTPHLPWKRLPIQVVTEPLEWPETDLRLAGVTALGLVGTNAHVVLSADPEPARQTTAQEATPPAPHLLTLSAKSRTALRELAQRCHEHLASHPETRVDDLCNTLGAGRSHYAFRAARVVQSIAECAEAFHRIAEEARDGGSHEANGLGGSVEKANEPRRLAWAYPEAIPDALRTIKSLSKEHPVFRETIESIAAALDEEHAAERARLIEAVADEADALPPEKEPGASGLSTYALQIGLGRLWRSWGFEPEAAVGAGVGQIAATCEAGGMGIEEGARLVAHRDRLLASLESLDREDPERAALLEGFEAFADTLDFYPPHLPLMCSLSGELVAAHRSLAGSYWRRHACESPLNLDALIEHAEIEGVGWLAFGTPPSASSEGSAKKECHSCLDPNKTASESLLGLLGMLYRQGTTIRFDALNTAGTCRRLSLPGHPFDRKRYWITDIAKPAAADGLTVQANGSPS